MLNWMITYCGIGGCALCFSKKKKNVKKQHYNISFDVFYASHIHIFVRTVILERRGWQRECSFLDSAVISSGFLCRCVFCLGVSLDRNRHGATPLSLYSYAFGEIRCPSGRKRRRKWLPLLLLLLRDSFIYFSARRTRDTCCVSIDGQVQLSPRRTSRGAAHQALLELFIIIFNFF